MTDLHEVIIVWGHFHVDHKGGIMDRIAGPIARALLLAFGINLICAAGFTLAAEDTKNQQGERRETIALTDAAIRALKSNLDITISRQTKESRLSDIVVEQAKFDPTLSVNGQYLRTVNPLNRPVFGGTQSNLTEITIFDQRNSSVTVDAQTNLVTGGNLDLNYSPAYTNVNPSRRSRFLVQPCLDRRSGDDLDSAAPTQCRP